LKEPRRTTWAAFSGKTAFKTPLADSEVILGNLPDERRDPAKTPQTGSKTRFLDGFRRRRWGEREGSVVRIKKNKRKTCNRQDFDVYYR